MGLGAACMYQGSRSMGDEISCQMSLPSFLELLVRLLPSLSIPVDALSALSIPKLLGIKTMLTSGVQQLLQRTSKMLRPTLLSKSTHLLLSF
jgi:hypothetical protein